MTYLLGIGIGILIGNLIGKIIGVWKFESDFKANYADIFMLFIASILIIVGAIAGV